MFSSFGLHGVIMAIVLRFLSIRVHDVCHVDDGPWGASECRERNVFSKCI